MTMYELAVAPFDGYGFMRRALVACLGLSFGSGIVGTLLVLRRMSLMGDALAHAILPGAAVGFLVGGLWLPALSIGGLAAGLCVAVVSGAVTRIARVREDASLGAAYPIALAFGVLIVSMHGSTVDLMHLLFGSILAVDDLSLFMVAGVATVTLLTMAAIYRPLVLECFDPCFLATVSGHGAIYHHLFLALTVLNLVAGFQALGTLMTVGLMILPAVAATFWAREIWGLALVSTLIAAAAGLVGLLVSFHADVPSGPTIVLAAGAVYALSVLFGRNGGLHRRLRPRRMLDRETRTWIMNSLLALFASLAFALAGPAPAAAQIRVVTSFTVLADMARNVGGDRVEVLSLVGPDGDAHVYEPTPADARTISQAQLVVVNGLGFEGWLDRLVQASGYRGPIVVATEGTSIRMMAARERAHAGHAHGHTHDGPTPDPHAWQDLAKAQAYVRNIAEGLARIDPANAPAYRANAAQYAARLAALDGWVRDQLAAVPAARRKVITSHDAFGHFGDAYGLTFLAPVGYSTESEPTARGIARLIAQIRREGIRAVFIENMSNPRIVERIANEAGAEIGGRLYADALSQPGGPADSYEAMFRHNVSTLLAGLMR